MKALKIIGILLVALVAIVLVLGVIAPKDFEAHRSIIVNAPAETVYKDFTSFEQFGKWNPWNKLDPNQKVTNTGTDGAVGSSRTWKGNDKVGEGTMTLTKVEPNKSAEYRLDFLKPFEAHNTAYMNMEPAEGGQKVTWGMKGKLPYPFNAMSLFMNMDKEMGKDFDEGLANFKTLCEADKGPAASYEVKETDWAEKNCLSIRQTVKFEDMEKYFGNNYPKISEAIGMARAKAGIPLAVFYSYDEKAKVADLAAAIPYEGKKVLAKGFTNLTLPASKAYVIDYFGAYYNMKPAYGAMYGKLKTLGKEKPDMVIEEYVADPMTEKDTTKWETKIYFFVK